MATPAAPAYRDPMTVTTPGGTATERRPRSWLSLAHDLRLRPRPAPEPASLVRPRRSRDVGACTRLLGVVYCADHYPDRLPGSAHAWLVRDVLDAWVAERHGQVLGHVATVRVGTDPLSAGRWREITGLSPAGLLGVSRFFVRRSERGKGLGTALLATAGAHARAQGLVPVLETVSESRTAIPTLRDAGWQLLAVDGRDARADRWRVHRYVGPRS
jgi:GNAT superfamily N-acetyltransferase